MRGRSWQLLLGVLLTVFLPVSGLAAPPAQRAILLVWDTQDDKQLEIYLELARSLKAERAAGLYASVAGLSGNFKVYDYNQSSHAQAVSRLGLKRNSDTPYLAVVGLDSNQTPRQIQWGTRVADSQLALAALHEHLRLPRDASEGGWRKTESAWTHPKGISIPLLPDFRVHQAMGKLHAVSDVHRTTFTFCAVKDDEQRDTILAEFRSDLLRRYPNIDLSPERISRRQGKTTVLRGGRVGAEGDHRVLLGYLSNNGRTLVLLGEVKGKLERDQQKELDSMLDSIEIR